MKLYVSPRAPSPRRVTIFLAEKGIADLAASGIELVTVSIAKSEHQSAEYRAISPHAKVPALLLDDGRVLTETRAICTYFDGHFNDHNLMGHDSTERAFIEMADRRIELYLMGAIANAIRHTHPGLAALEQPQFPDFGRSQGDKMRGVARWLDGELAKQPFVAGARFTVADVTAFIALEFARGLLKFHPGDEGMPHLQAYRDRWLERPSAQIL
jgi:glutathione S-transferase